MLYVCACVCAFSGGTKPSNVRASLSGKDAINVEWDSAGSAGNCDRIDSYRVKLTKDDGSIKYLFVKDTTCMFVNLDSGRYINVSVCVEYNHNGNFKYGAEVDHAIDITAGI